MEYLLKASIIVAIFYGFYKIFLEKETFFQSNRWFLIAGIIIAIILPYINIPIYVENTSQPIQDFAILNSTESIIKENTVEWLEILKYIYLCGVIFLSGKLVLNIISLGNLLIKHPNKKIDNYSMISINEDLSPFSFFNFIVFNPNQFGREELEQIINHEKVHAFQFHSIDIILSQFASIIFWFNPFIWLYKKELIQNLEFIADDKAQQASICKKNYQLLLLKTSVSKNQLALTNNFYNSLIKKRIIMLHKNRSKNTSQWKFTLMIPLIVAFIFTFNTEVISQNNNSKKNKVQDIQQDSQMVLIDKDTNDEGLNNIKNIFSKEGVTVKFKGLKRNNKGEITTIKIEVDSKQSSANYNTDSADPIEPIKISFNNEGGNIAIGSSEIHHGKGYAFIAKDGKHNLVSNIKGNKNFVFISDKNSRDDNEVVEIKSNGGNVFVIKKDGDNKVIDLKEDSGKKVWITEDGNKNVEVIELKEGDGDHNMFVYSDKNNNNPIFYIDGKEASKEDIENLNSESIEKMNVYKGDIAIKKYGDKAKDGVINITTKKK